jgi:tocopherol cyclase
MKNYDVMQIDLNKENKFEGYYFKHVSDEMIISFIVGVSTFIDDKHCFIQVIRNNPNSSHYFRFKYEDFNLTNNEEGFHISIMNNFFSFERLVVNLVDAEIQINTNIEYDGLTKLKKPIMGPYRHFPYMECNHGIVSMFHDVYGYMKIDGKTFDFNNSVGYIEKDWGSSFPRNYLWLQNVDKIKKESLFLSVATIPYLKNEFVGFIANVFYDDKQLVFATYNFSKFKFTNITENGYSVELKKGKYKLIITAKLDMGMELIAPVSGHMNKMIKEGLKGEVKYTLYNGNKIVCEGESDSASMELVEHQLLNN